jgi:hypothetical protein
MVIHGSLATINLSQIGKLGCSDADSAPTIAVQVAPPGPWKAMTNAPWRMMREVAENMTELRVPNAAHWIGEENPRALFLGLLTFREKSEAARDSQRNTLSIIIAALPCGRFSMASS